MKVRSLSCWAAAAWAIASPTDAATIRLIDLSCSVAGSRAEAPLRIAAGYWEGVLTNPVVINVGVRFEQRPCCSMGGTDIRRVRHSIRAWEAAVLRTRSTSAIDAAIMLPQLRRGAIEALTAGIDALGRNDRDVVSRLRRSQASSRYLMLASAVAKATGLRVRDPERVDAVISLSRNYAFDYDPVDGVASPGVDIVAVAIHELGHALGFGSGVADLDNVTAPFGPAAGMEPTDFNDHAAYGALDMFRYDAARLLDFRPGAATFLSIDGGRTALLGARFATGAFNGDGDQAGHFKDTAGPCAMSVGIMDAARCGGRMGVVTGADLAALDAIGWNLRLDALHVADRSTGDLARLFRAGVGARGMTALPTLATPGCGRPGAPA